MDVPHHETHCSFSTGIDGSITAGRGALDYNGYWEFPCDDCAKRANYNWNEARKRDAEIADLRAQLAARDAEITELKRACAEWLRDITNEIARGDKAEAERDTLAARIDQAIKFLDDEPPFDCAMLRAILTDAPDGGPR